MNKELITASIIMFIFFMIFLFLLNTKLEEDAFDNAYDLFESINRSMNHLNNKEPEPTFLDGFLWQWNNDSRPMCFQEEQ